jgi:uncharacterized protein (DUF2062 family)
MWKRALATMKRNAAVWLRQGISPRRLALTLALGFAIGCIPVVGIPTLLCAGLALALKLNLPAIQAANYVVMPLQIALIVPFVRLGDWLFHFGSSRAVQSRPLLHTPPLELLLRMGGLAGQAMQGWLVIALPAVALMTVTLTLVLRRVPAVAAAELATTNSQ